MLKSGWYAKVYKRRETILGLGSPLYSHHRIPSNGSEAALGAREEQVEIESIPVFLKLLSPNSWEWNYETVSRPASGALRLVPRLRRIVSTVAPSESAPCPLCPLCPLQSAPVRSRVFLMLLS